MKVYVRDGVYIPIKNVTSEQKDEVKRRFEKDFYKKELACEKCDYFSERPCDICDSCANFGGTLKLHRKVEIKGKKFLRLPFGDMKGVQKIFGDVIPIYKLDEVPMKRQIKFTAELRDYQEAASKAMRKSHGGVLKSPPRTGKTVMSAHVVCKLGLKTLILASQRDWLENFYETFVGSDTQVAMTNAKTKRVGFAKTVDDFKKYDVALATYQTFLSESGKKKLEKIKRMFSVLVVDEVQTVPANEFSVVVNQLQCLYKFGLSGTPQRKDGREWTAYKLMGPVVYETQVDKLVPEVQIKKTELRGVMPKTWVYMVKKIECDPARLKLIAEEAIKDVKLGHGVMIPMAGITPIKALTDAINQMVGKRNYAAAFYGAIPKQKRKDIIERARNYKTKVVVGNTRLLSTGINIPRLSMLYEVTPSSNQPKAEQRFSRVLTPMEGKPQPVIKYFLDDIDVRRSCIRSEFFGTLYPQFRPKMNPDVKDKFYNYMQGHAKNKQRARQTHSGGYI